MNLVEDQLGSEREARWRSALQKSLAHYYMADRNFTVVTNHLLMQAVSLYLGGKQWDRDDLA